MMQNYQLPFGGRCGKLSLKPGRLDRGARDSIRFMDITIQHKEMYWSPNKIIITFIAWQREVIQIRLRIWGIPIMISHSGKEAVRGGACTI